MMTAQGTSPRLESGAVLLFFDPAGLNFAMEALTCREGDSYF
jgi:hypothetical protein